MDGHGSAEESKCHFTVPFHHSSLTKFLRCPHAPTALFVLPPPSTQNALHETNHTISSGPYLSTGPR